ncbi:MAG: sensor histidine kinase [Faecalibacterium sp.]
MFAALLVLLTGLHGSEVIGTWYSYVHMAACYGVFCFAAQTLFRENARYNAVRVLCFYLVLDCTDTLIRYFGMRILGVDYLRSGHWLCQCMAAAVWCGVTLLLLLLVRRNLPAAPAQSLGNSALWAAVLATLPYLFVCQITYWLPLQNEELTAAVPLTLAASCLVAVLSIINFIGRVDAEIQKRQALQRQHMMECRQQQFLLSKRTAEAVQRNYHDLKNVLLYLERSSDTEQTRQYIRRVMGQIHPFEALVETGSETMDILLSEKLALCQREQIACTVDVEGKLFEFIDPLELCTLVGNAMDNAIEACLKLPEPSARRILFRSMRRGSFAVLCVRNSFDGCLPRGAEHTTKPDAENHGYGLASIRQAAAAYGGEVSYGPQGNEFVLTMLFPLPEAAEKAN